MKRFFSVLPTFTAVLLFSGYSAYAATDTWNGGSGSWNSANWTAATPGAVGTTSNGDTAVFNSGTGSVSIDATRNVKSITFDTAAGAYTLTGGPLWLTSGGTIQIASTFSGAGTAETITAPIVLEGSYNFTNANTNSANTLNFGGNITTASGNVTLTLNGANAGANTISGAIGNGAGTIALSLGGTANWILSSANTFAGATSIGSTNTLQIQNNNALQNSVVTQGNTTANGLIFSTGTDTVNIGGLSGGGNVKLQDGLTGSGNAVTLQIGLFNNDSGNTSSGVISGSGGITKVGAGTQTFSGNNTYTGSTVITGVTGDTLTTSLSTSGTPFGTGAVTINGGSLNFTPSAAASTPSFTIDSGATNSLLTYGAGSIINLTKKDTSSKVTVTAGGGGTVLSRTNNGTLVVQTSAADLGTGAASSENFVINGTAPTINATNKAVNATMVTLGGGTASMGDFMTYGGTFTGFGPDSANYTARSGTIAASTTGSNEISNVNATASFTGNNTTYDLLVQSGITATLNTGVTLNVGDGGTGNPAGIILNGGTIASQTTNGGASGNGLTGTINFGTEEGIIYAFNGTGNVQAAITGTGGVTLSGSGNKSIVLGKGGSATGSTFTGGLNIDDGVTLSVQGNNGGGIGVVADNSQFGAPTNSINLNGGTLAFAGESDYASRPVTVGAVGGTISGSGGNYNLIISGPGALTYAFGGNFGGYIAMTGVSTYTGGTYINSGLLGISASSEIGSSPITFVGNGSPAGISIMGTSLHSLANTMTFDANTGGPYAIDVQNSGNTFTLSSTQVLNSGTAGFAKYGAGTLALDGAETYSGTTYLFGGTLEVDATAGGSLGSLTPLQMDGGTLYILGSGTTTVQNLGNVTSGNKINSAGLNAGGTIAVNGNGGTATLNLGTLPGVSTNGVLSPINPGSSISLQVVGSGGSITTTSAPDGTTGTGGNGIYSGRAVYVVENSAGVITSADWATSSSAGPTYTLTGYNNYTNLSVDVANGGYNPSNNDKEVTNRTLNAPTAINSLKIANTGSTSLDLAGNSLTLTSGGLLFTGTSAYTIKDTVGGGGLFSGLQATGGSLNNGQNTSPDAYELYVQDYGTGVLTISAALTNPAITGTTFGTAGQAALFTKAGPGTLVLSGTNTYSGTTYINGGVLSISSDSNIGGSNGTVTGLTSLTTSATVTTTTALPAGFGVGSQLLGRQVNTITYSGGTYTITLSGNAGTALTGGTASFATEGGVVINGGTLQVTSSITMQQSNTGGTAGTTTLSRNIQLGSSGGTVNVTNGSTFTYDGTLSSTDSGYSSFTLDSNDGSNGLMILNSNSGASVLGGITINGGILQPNYAGSLSTNNDGNLTLAFGSGSETNPATGTTVNTTPTLYLGNNQSFSALDSPSSTTAVVKATGGSEYLTIANGGSDSYSGLLANGAAANVLGFTKGGSGIQYLKNTNSDYTGITTIDAGTLNVASLANGGTTAITPTISTTAISTSATLSSTAGLVSGQTYAVASANVPAGTTFLYVGSANVTLSSAATATASGTATVLGLPSAIGMATNAAGNLVFGGATNGSAVLQYTGTTGAVSTDHLFTIGDASNSSGRSGINGSISGNTATLDSSSTTAADTMSFSNMGSIAFVNSAYTHNLTLTGTNTGTTTSMNTFAPLLADMAGGQSTSLNKTGTGSWAVTNNNNSYSGGTTVTAGTLYGNGGVAGTSSGLGTGAINVSGGAAVGGSGVYRPTTAGAGITLLGTASSLVSGGVQTSTTAGAGITLDNTVAAGTILNASTGTANLTFSLGAGNPTSAGYMTFSNPNTASTYMTVYGSTAGQLSFAAGDSITLTDLTSNLAGGFGSGATTLQLDLNTPYLLIQAESTAGLHLLTDNNLYAGLMTTGGIVGGVLQNGYVTTPLVIGGTVPAGENALLGFNADRLYLYNGELELVPEPGTWALMLGGLAVLVFLQRRRSKNS